METNLFFVEENGISFLEENGTAQGWYGKVGPVGTVEKLCCSKVFE